MDNSRKRGKRIRGGASAFNAGLRDIHSKVRGNASHNLTGRSTSAIAVEAAKYFDCAEVEENRNDHIVPRQSITHKYMLPFFPQRIELQTVPSKQLDLATFKGTFANSQDAVNASRMIATTDNRVGWKSDRTLLNRSRPDTDITALRLKREGSVSVGLNSRKLIRPDNEKPSLPGVVLRYADKELWFQTEQEAKAYRRTIRPMPVSSTITPDDTDIIGPAAPDDLL